jgi:hypothetical protein
VRMDHFTPYDLNWPWWPDPLDPPPPPEQPPPDETKKKDPCAPGSIIHCMDQTLEERLPITGTPFHLTYRSDWVPGRQVEIPIVLSGSGTCQRV